MTDLVEWLKACLDEDERLANAAPGSAWRATTQDSVADAAVYDEQWRLLQPEWYDHDQPLSNEPGTTGPMYIQKARDELVAHIARWDPARVLAEVQAKRAIIERLEFVSNHGPAVDHTRALDMTIGARAALVDVVKMLAQPYADRPGYRTEWAPE